MKGRWIGGVITGLAAMGLVMTGCGEPKPCPVPESMVESSRGTLGETQRATETALSRRQDLESEIANKKSRIRDLEDRKQSIESELAELLGQ